ncbi:periplasmic binding protein/LacI transcriptional regulator (plasmid) [Pseudovibrio sp. FO-BEG1]|uniref:LacI family DNA-binding transcriptional regulator n=1 Tax=Pseudovibrio TaxID=258255 RepID=UPI000238CA7A|nr:LacI family DNA-binding transcriptional regulator [Pseudovibrio sp. FO-BEG1]AEV39711.1 periplasmic binding protein/LacI transcriptional regulator [Pseudovibrio sp. FO-BEG1]
MVTITDIANRAGVSPSVVSRIVNGDKKLRVSAATRARVQAIIEETGYKPNVAARSLRSSETGLLALVVHDITNPVYSEIVAGAQAGASEFDKIILVGEADSLGANVSKIESLIAGGGVDGLILQGAGTELDKAIEHAVSRKIPLVFLQSGDINIAPVLRMDDLLAGKMATQYLIDHGHKNIGVISTKRNLQFSEARLDGWKQALVEASLPISESAIAAANPNYESGYHAAKELFEQRPDITAILVSNAMSAVGALAYLNDAGKRVPEDVSVIGINDVNLAEFVRPALTVVKMPLRTMGLEAVRMICSGKTSSNKKLEILDQAPLLVERSSVSKR